MKTIIRIVAACLIALYPLFFPLSILAETEGGVVEETSTIPIPSTPESTPEPTTTPPTPSVTPESTPEPTPEPSASTDLSPTPSSMITPSPTSEPSPEIITPDIASSTPQLTTEEVVQNQTTVAEEEIQTSAETGQNIIQQPEATTASMVTGDALALADVTNVENVVAINSPFTIVTITVTPEQLSDINLDAIWQELKNAYQDEDPNALPTFLATHQYISLETSVQAHASTGNNTLQSAENTFLQTGNATAAANLVTLANASLINSCLMIGVINILPNSSANIILPHPSEFLTALSTGEGLGAYFSTQTVTASTTAEVSASSGQNVQSAQNNSLQTGNSISLANILLLLNYTFLDTSFMSFTLNNAGGWLGSAPGTTIYSFGQTSLPETNPLSFFLSTENQALINNQVIVTASTGNNQTTSQSNSTISTGQAAAIANVFSLVNVNLIHSQIFLGVANILGSWFGNIKYADVEYDTDPPPAPVSSVQSTSESSVDNSPIRLELVAANNVRDFIYFGDTVSFELTLKNTSGVDASNVTITQYIINSNDETVGTTVFQLGTVKADRNGTLRFGITLIDDQQLKPGMYHTLAFATGYAPNGSATNSNNASTMFTIKNHHTKLAIIPPVQAAETVVHPGVVLGAQTISTPPSDVIPYILLCILTILWFIAKSNQKETPPNLIKTTTNILAYLFVITVFCYSIYKIYIFFTVFL